MHYDTVTRLAKVKFAKFQKNGQSKTNMFLLWKIQPNIRLQKSNIETIFYHFIIENDFFVNKLVFSHELFGNISQNNILGFNKGQINLESCPIGSHCLNWTSSL